MGCGPGAVRTARSERLDAGARVPSRVPRAPFAAAAVSLALLAAAPMNLSSWPQRNLYLGYIGVNPRHNPTLLLLRPLALGRGCWWRARSPPNADERPPPVGDSWPSSAWGRCWRSRATRSILYSAAVVVCFFGAARKQPALGLAWTAFLFGCAYAYLLAETGWRQAHGNLLWSAQVTLFVLFVATTALLLREGLAPRRAGGVYASMPSLRVPTRAPALGSSRCEGR